ncbi:MAG: hypothetical protein DLM55_01125 [Acidimicrobiales bacterium]|nr:MAG: hypothetical protein DLM55_01125 [Acidimicrobiales bacterium]
MSFAPMLPWWAVAVVFIPLLVVAVLLVVVQAGERTRWRRVRRVLMVLLLAAIAVRPSFGESHQPAQLSNLDVFFVVDATPSAAAEDYNGHQPRIAGIRRDIKAITASLAGARFTLITFANATEIRVPLTTDSAAVDTSTDLLDPSDALYSGGSGIDEPVASVTKQLAQAQAEQPKRTRMVIYLGDGEQTVNRAVGSFAPWSAHVSGGAVFGYGSTGGGKMRHYDAVTGNLLSYVIDAAGNDALSRYDPATLRTAATQIGVPFTHRTSPGRVRANLDVPKTHPVSSTRSGAQRHGEAYWVLAVALGLLATIELAGVARRAGSIWRAT